MFFIIMSFDCGGFCDIYELMMCGFLFLAFFVCYMGFYFLLFWYYLCIGYWYRLIFKGKDMFNEVDDF